MTRAGADVTILTNGAHAAVLENRPVTAEVLLEQVHDVDLILTEGYKHGPWKKIALYRAAVGKPLSLCVGGVYGSRDGYAHCGLPSALPGL